MSQPLRRPAGRVLLRVDDKLRFRIPPWVLPAIESHLPWIITSLDGEIIRMYPVEEWVKARTALLAGGKEGQAVLAFAELHVCEYGLDNMDRMLLPPSLPSAKQLRHKQVLLVWRRDHVEVVSAETPVSDSSSSARS